MKLTSLILFKNQHYGLHLSPVSHTKLDVKSISTSPIKITITLLSSQTLQRSAKHIWGKAGEGGRRGAFFFLFDLGFFTIFLLSVFLETTRAEAVPSTH